MTGVLSVVMMAAGAAWMLVAAIGVLRMPDVYLRMSVTSKASTLGLGLLLAGAALHFGGGGVLVRAGAIAAFLVLTTPVAAHVISRAAYLTGVPLWKGTVCDDLRGRYDGETHSLNGEPE